MNLGRILLVVSLLLVSCGREVDRVVVVYVSEDQVFSEPILRDFEVETGIKVRAIYDTEEAKSTGVMNRLIAEKDNPQADVYWANEPIRAEVLKRKGITTPCASPNAAGIPGAFKDADGYWVGFSARARVLLVHKKLEPKPGSIFAYTDPALKGKGAIANPLFGTTTTHVAALFVLWGDDRARKFLEDLKRNETQISSSNGETADLVAAGTAMFGMVDSDDASSLVKQGKPVDMIVPEDGCLVIPNAVMMIKGAPHTESAKRLIDYLLSKQTEKKLAFAACAQIPLNSGVEVPAHVIRMESVKSMKIDYATVSRKMEEIQPFLKAWVGY